MLQIENLEELLKGKDNQVDIARNKLSAVQAQTFSSEGTVTSLEKALVDQDKQSNQLRDQRDRDEKDIKDEKVFNANIKLNTIKIILYSSLLYFLYFIMSYLIYFIPKKTTSYC